MQYKNTQKILIDKRKLDILLRLNCPKENIYEAIVNNKIIYTNDELIDDNLESLVDVKVFENWGGSRNGAGRKSSNNKKINQDENQLENQDENQDANQDVNQEPNQVVDIDIDIDKDNNIDNLFNNFYNKYPNKKSKTKALISFKKALKKVSFEKLMDGLENYLKEIEIKKTEKQYIKHPATWLNQECWLDEYENKESNKDRLLEMIRR